MEFGTILFPYQKCVTYIEEHISKKNSLSSSGQFPLINYPGWLVPTEIRFMLGGFQFHSKMVQLAFLNYKGLLNYELCISRLLPQHHKKALFIAYWFLK